MKDYGIFEVQTDDDGHFYVTEQITGEVTNCDSVEEVVQYIRSVLEEVDEED